MSIADDGIFETRKECYNSMKGFDVVWKKVWRKELMTTKKELGS